MNNKHKLKQKINNLVKKRRFEEIILVCQREKRGFKVLRSLLYASDERVCWAAVEAVAKLMQNWWQNGKKERVREFIRNLFWSMNDESGGIGWFSPQTIAEIIAHIPELLKPYGSMMLYHALEEPPLVKGGLWGIGRLGKRIKEDVEFFKDKVLEVFSSNDPQILGTAAWAMGEVGLKLALPYLEALQGRNELVKIYIEGQFWEKTLNDWATEATKKIKGGLV